jgi:hypothetical protein
MRSHLLNNGGSRGAGSFDSETRTLQPRCYRAAILREELVSLSDSRSRTHPESGPAGANPCHSLLLAGQTILGSDLHEWLFLLVNRLRKNRPGLSL